MSQSRLLFVTGKLAEPALRRTLAQMGGELDYVVAVLPITVISLATTQWIARHLTVPSGVNRVLLPGLCRGDLAILKKAAGVEVERGPKDLLDLPDYLAGERKKSRLEATPAGFGEHDIEILAEINSAPRLSLAEIVQQAQAYRASGADIIDLGCDPGDDWAGVGEAVHALRAEGFRVSIDSFNPREVEAAVAAGAELVLSVNSSNLSAARSWGCEVAAIPDVPATLEGLERTVEALQSWGVRFRIDPILEPIGFGFAASLGRYLEVRRRYPKAEMLMGVGNLTELTEVDSAGVNVLLLGFCQEVGIRSVLTTQVINWCRSAVQELDLARKLVYFACKEKVLPKHLDASLVMLRDPRLRVHGEATLQELASRLTDRNFRLYAERGLLHVLNSQAYLQGTDPFALFADMMKRQEIDPAHAFYLGYELAKAKIALALGKNYMQDQALEWGFLTVPEAGHGNTIE